MHSKYDPVTQHSFNGYIEKPRNKEISIAEMLDGSVVIRLII